MRLQSASRGLLRRSRLRTGAIAFVWLIGLPGAFESVAQQSRAEEHARKQAEKAKSLTPYEPTRLERILTLVEQSSLLTGAPEGLYPYFGSVYPGGGLALGPAARLPIGDTGALSATAAWSIRNYKLAEARLELPALAGRRIRIVGRARWMDAPRLAFYGIGNDTRADARATTQYRPMRAGVSGRLRPVKWLTFGAGVDYEHVATGPGRGGTSVEERFADVAVPGLGLDFAYLVGRARIEIDSRSSPGYSRRGGHYVVDFSDYRDRDHRGFSFRRIDAEATHLVPILRENWVVALRGLVSLTEVDGDNQVPYLLLPSLGSGTELRGLSDFRFRDRNRMLLSAEYRWTPAHVLDMAVFVERGKVAASREDLNFTDLHTS